MSRRLRIGRLPLGTGVWLASAVGVTIALVGLRMETARLNEKPRTVSYHELANGEIPPGTLVRLGPHLALYDLSAVEASLPDGPGLPAPDLPPDANVDPNTRLPRNPGEVDFPNRPILTATEGYYPILPASHRLARRTGVTTLPKDVGQVPPSRLRVWVETDEFNYDGGVRRGIAREGALVGRVRVGDLPQVILQEFARQDEAFGNAGRVVIQKGSPDIPGPGRFLMVLGAMMVLSAGVVGLLRARRRRRQGAESL